MSNEIKFTNGKWGFKRPEQSDCTGKIKAGDKVVCEVHFSEWDLPVNVANANLISAAPELYNILELLRSNLESNYGSGNLEASTKVLLQEAFYVLLRARGES